MDAKTLFNMHKLKHMCHYQFLEQYENVVKYSDDQMKKKLEVIKELGNVIKSGNSLRER